MIEVQQYEGALPSGADGVDIANGMHMTVCGAQSSANWTLVPYYMTMPRSLKAWSAHVRSQAHSLDLYIDDTNFKWQIFPFAIL